MGKYATVYVEKKHDQVFHIVGKTSNRLVVLRVDRVNDSFRFGVLQIGDQFCVFHSHDQCRRCFGGHRSVRLLVPANIAMHEISTKCDELQKLVL